MVLDVLRLRAIVLGGRVRQPPFRDHVGFTDHWWGHTVRTDHDWLSLRSDDTEVARAKIMPGSHVGEYYGAIAPPQGWTEIDRLEVRGDLRLRGVGRAAVQAIAAEYPSTRLAALSEDADGFWSSLSWAAHRHRIDGPAYRTLFLSD